MAFSKASFNKPQIEKFFKFEPACLTAAGSILDLDTISKNGRFYVTPEGNQYPSMTTILGATSDKTYLDEWRERIGADKADRISHYASSRGSDMHNICEAYVRGDKSYLDDVTPVGKKLFFQIKQFLDVNLGTVFGIEQALYSDKHKTAGRTDLIGIYKNKRSVIDYKSSGEFKSEDWINDYFVQGAGYATLFTWMTDIEVEQIVILVGVENGIRGQEFTVPYSDYKEQFEARVNAYSALIG